MWHKSLVPLWCPALVVAACLTFSGAACVRRSIEPTPSSTLIENVFLNDGSSLYVHHDGADGMECIFSSTDGAAIQSFVPSPSGDIVYLVLTRRDEHTGQRESTVSRLAGNGAHTELLSSSSCIDCDGASVIGDIHLSPDERFLALDVYLYEGCAVAIWDLDRRTFVSLDGGPNVDYESFLVWHPDRDALFASAFDCLIEYDIELGTRRFLSSPNIRDYVTEAELLEQGYLGERVDYEPLIGEKRPSAVSWHPGGWHFTFERDGDLYVLNLADSTEELLHDFEDGAKRAYRTRYRILWNEGAAVPDDPPEYGDADLIVRIDSTWLGTLTPLNDSIVYDFGMKQSISYFQPSWNNRIAYPNYFFRETLSVEKIHVAEMDFFFRTYAMRLTPGFWYLLGRYKSNRITDEELAAEYAALVEDYADDLHLFRGIKYPEVLRDRKELYQELVSRDYRFERSLAEYVSENDLVALSDSVFVLLQGQSEEEIDSVLAILSDPDSGRRERLVSFYQEMSNRFLNYYGNVIANDLKVLKEQLRIDEIWE